MNTIDTNSLRAVLQYKDRDKLKEAIGQKDLRVYIWVASSIMLFMKRRLKRHKEQVFLN